MFAHVRTMKKTILQRITVASCESYIFFCIKLQVLCKDHTAILKRVKESTSKYYMNCEIVQLENIFMMRDRPMYWQVFFFRIKYGLPCYSEFSRFLTVDYKERWCHMIPSESYYRIWLYEYTIYGRVLPNPLCD